MTNTNPRILCVGAEIEMTDHMVSQMAEESQSVNHGLISDPRFVPQADGFYHTTIVDLNEGQIEKISQYFDKLLLLDQPRDCYPHFKTLLKTFRLFKSLDDKGVAVEYKNNSNTKNLEYWWNYLRQNPSFCFQPFLALVPDTDKTNICPKSKIPIKTPNEIVDWRTDKDYRVLRDRMLAGKKLPLYCHDCYDKESRGVESARQFETLEWAARMDFALPEDFDRVADPVFYEIRPSNKCNIMCRMCDDARSHLIERERIELNLPLMPYRFKDLPFENIKFERLQRIYVGGGEPTIMPEFYDFLQKCVNVGRTDFELCIGTNGMKISNKLLDLLSHFSDVLFSFSFDGYRTINDYIRWRSNFDTVVRNSRLVREHGHKIGLQTVPSIYNVTRLHEIFEFYDDEFPTSTCLVQAAEGHQGVLLPWHHPRADLVIDSIQRCMRTNQYLMNGRSLKSYVDSLYNIYSSSDYRCDLTKLKGFFEFNDLMDRARGSRLGDYIPELEESRKLIA